MTNPGLLWLVPVLFTLHNIEELVGSLLQPHQIAVPGRKELPPAQIQIAAGLLTMMVWGGSAWGMNHLRNAFSIPLIIGFQAVICVNSLFPHLVFAIRERRYHPGLYSAVAVNLPFSFYLFYLFVAEGMISLQLLAGLLAAGPVLMVLLIRGALAAARGILLALAGRL